MHMLARQSGLVDAIDRRLHLLKLYLPYRESDHVLNIAYNALCEGRTLEDIELRRNDETFLDALGAERIPDPTTAGDFCRRFVAADIGRLQDAIDEARLNVWARQEDDFFEQATIDMDGSLVAGLMPPMYWSRSSPRVWMRLSCFNFCETRPSDRRKVTRSTLSGGMSRPSSNRLRLSSSRPRQPLAAFSSPVCRERVIFRPPCRKTIRNELPCFSRDAIS